MRSLRLQCPSALGSRHRSLHRFVGNGLLLLFHRQQRDVGLHDLLTDHVFRIAAAAEPLLTR